MRKSRDWMQRVRPGSLRARTAGRGDAGSGVALQTTAASGDRRHIGQGLGSSTARSVRQKGAVRPARDHGLGVGADGERSIRPHLAGCCCARADLAKIGQLVLNHGVLARTADRLGRLDRRDDGRAEPARLDARRLGGDAYGYLWWRGRAGDRQPRVRLGRRQSAREGSAFMSCLASIWSSPSPPASIKRGGLQDVAGDTALDMVLRAATSH